MADDKTLTEDDDLEIVEVDKVPTAEEIAAREATDTGGADDAHEDDDDEDTRLAERDEDDASEASKKRKQRRASQKAARDRTLAELDSFRTRFGTLEKELAELRGHTAGMTEREIATKAEATKSRIADFDAIIAKAIEDGDGTGATTAMRLRDEARDEVRGLDAAANQIKTARENPTKTGPDPRVTENASAWRTANPWYDSKGGDANSAIVNSIDNQLMAEKFDPTTPGYWQELTRRVSARLGADDAGDKGGGTRERTGARKGPPVGGDRSAGSPGSRKEVYVTPERKAAMVEAGIWDDPVKRTKMLKSYREYDAQQSAR